MSDSRIAPTSLPQTGETHDLFVANLSQLHHQYSDRQGIVYLQYQTSLYLTEPI